MTGTTHPIPSAFIAALLAVSTIVSVSAGQPGVATPPKPGPGFFQKLTPAISVETNVSPAYTEKVYQMVWKAEQRFYNLFKLTPDLMNGVSKAKFDAKANIPGDILNGFRPFITLRVHKEQESFADEWFELTGVTDKEKRVNTGLPGAYFSIHPDYDKKLTLRDIRSFVDNRDDDELERTLLHEMGHLFMHSYLLEFAGSPPPGQESQKRGTPAWLGEGTAQLFEVLWSNAKSAQKQRDKDQCMIYEAIKMGDTYPFEEFVNVTNAHNLAAVAGNPLKATINYAQSFCVMDYFVNVDGARFFNFLQNLRQMNFERNLRNPNRDHVRELYSFQDECFKKAYSVGITDVEQHWKKHMIKTVEEKLKKFPENNYWNGEYYLRRGKDKENDYKKAEELFDLAIKGAPDKGLGYLGKGRLLVRRGESEDAEKVLAKAVELLPKDEDAWYFYGMAQVNSGKLTEAVASFEKSLKIYPRSARATSGLALAAFHSNEYKKSVDAYEAAYQITHDPRYLMQKGQSAFFGKDYKEAQRAFNAYITVFSKDPQGHLWYGLSALRLNEKEFGLKKIEEAAKLNPADPMIATALKMAQKGESLVFQRESEAVAEADKKDDTKPGEKKKPKVQLVDDE